MIDIAAIPVINGDPDMVDEHATSLTTTGAAFADTGARIHAGWQALTPVYIVPEAGDLLAATGPVQGVAASVGDVQDAVHTKSGDVLTRLPAEAAFDHVSASQEEPADGDGE